MALLRLRELPEHETPRWRIREVGASALSDAELLSILLRAGTADMNVLQLAQKLMIEHGGWKGLQRVDYETLCQQHGIGDGKAAVIKATLEIARRLLLSEQEQRMQIRSPIDAANLL